MDANLNKKRDFNMLFYKIETTGYNPNKDKIIYFVYKLNWNETKVFKGEELNILQHVFNLLKTLKQNSNFFSLVGFANLMFDCPFLYHKFIKYKIPYYEVKSGQISFWDLLYEVPQIDLRQMAIYLNSFCFKGTSYTKFCRSLGIEIPEEKNINELPENKQKEYAISRFKHHEIYSKLKQL